MTDIAPYPSPQEGLAITDERGRIAAVNAILCCWTGYRSDELLEFASINELAPGVWPAATAADSGGRGVEEDGSLFFPDSTIVNKQGQTIPVQIHGYPVMGRGSDPFMYSYVICDRHLKDRSGEQLRLIEKMRSAGNLAAVVGHDINNLIGVVLGQAEIGMLDVDETHPVYSALKEIVEAAMRTTALTGKLLSIAGREPATPESLELNAWISALLPQLHHVAGPQIEISWKPSSSPCQVKVDPDQGRRMLVILLENAREAIEATAADRGLIRLSVQAVESEFAGAPESGATRRDRYARLTIEDNGEGIDPAARSRLFEPFYTTRAPSKGRGLGLATLYGLVKQNHGYVELDKSCRQGTTIHLYLPMCPGCDT